MIVKCLQAARLASYSQLLEAGLSCAGDDGQSPPSDDNPATAPPAAAAAHRQRAKRNRERVSEQRYENGKKPRIKERCESPAARGYCADGSLAVRQASSHTHTTMALHPSAGDAEA